VGLSAALLLQPDILLLDEPTNHLDADALEWLADFLKPGGRDKDMTMLLVTHDRYFLERVCSEIVELDRAQLYRYPGNYTKYIELKASRLAAEDAESERARIKLRRESEWMAKQPRARQAKSKVRQEQFYELVEQSKRRVEAQAVEFASPEEKERQKRLGGIVAEFRGACYDMHGRTLLNGFTYDFRQRDRIGICGPNGVGKSTFLKILVGEIELSKGTARLGETVRVGYYEQAGLSLTPEQEKLPVLKFVQEAVEMGSKEDKSTFKGPTQRIVVTENTKLGRRKVLAGKEAQITVDMKETFNDETTAMSERDAMKLLSKFQFPSKRWYDRVGKLSGGERRRIQLLQVLAKNPNFLVLDEPSNDLDLQTLTALEEYLTESFDGCLVVVSHDNFFVNRVCEHLFIFEGDGIVRDFQGSYTDYMDYRRSVATTGKRKDENVESKKERKERASLDAAPTYVENLSTTVAMTNAERKEFNKLEKEVAKLQDQIDVISTKLANAEPNIGYSVLADWTKEMEDLKKSLELKEERWMELAAKAA
jgi:ABC transport system ATP-binding/permease protein